MPGEQITTEEEFAAGENTFAQKGKIKSSALGVAEFDNNAKEVRVKGKTVKGLEYGDVVLGKVSLVKESNVVIELLDAENGKKIMGIKTAQIPVRNVSQSYVSDLKQYFKVGDIVKGKVAMASPLAIDLITNETGLGVIKAYCSNCRKEMHFSNGKLMCLNCGSVEERKWFEAVETPRERSPGRGFGDRGGYGGRGGGRGFGGRDRGSFGGRGGGRSFGGRGGFGGGRGREDRGSFGRSEGRSFGGESRGRERSDSEGSRGFGGSGFRSFNGRGHSRGGMRHENRSN